MATLAVLRVSLHRNGPVNRVTVAAAVDDLPISGVHVVDRPAVNTASFPTPGEVVEIDLTGLLDGWQGGEPGSGGVPVELAAEVLRVAATGALAARGLRPVELVDWVEVAHELGAR